MGSDIYQFYPFGKVMICTVLNGQSRAPLLNVSDTVGAALEAIVLYYILLEITCLSL